MAVFFMQSKGLFAQGRNVVSRINLNHPFIKAAMRLNWEEMFEKLMPIIYRGINRFKGRHLDLRAHCGIYLLQSLCHWTDRFSEDMLSNHAAVRIFCGIDADPEKSIDHTSIEKFRNKRLGKEGAEVMNAYLLQFAQESGYTSGKHVDMDTTVQEAGISYPTEMNLMKKLQERVIVITEKVLGKAHEKVEDLKGLYQETKKKIKEYRFFTKAKETKKELVRGIQEISISFLEWLQSISEMKEEIAKIRPYLQKELSHLLAIVPLLLEQIRHWLDTGKVACGKIISLYKMIPRFIKKGKLGKPVEIGRKWIVNQLVGGFLQIIAPENPVIADTDCVKISLQEIMKVFGEAPESYGTDRGMYSKENIELCRECGIKDIGIQPKGRAEWEVEQETARNLYCRRAGIEPRIGVAGRLGLKRSRAKSDDGDIISGYKAGIGFNLMKLMRCWAQ